MAGKLEPLGRLTLGPFFGYKVGAVLQNFLAAIDPQVPLIHIRTTALV